MIRCNNCDRSVADDVMLDLQPVGKHLSMCSACRSASPTDRAAIRDESGRFAAFVNDTETLERRHRAHVERMEQNRVTRQGIARSTRGGVRA